MQIFQLKKLRLNQNSLKLTSEIDALILILREIERIHLQKKDSKNYLSINSLASFGQVQEILSHIEQLSEMLINQSLDPVLEKEISKTL